MLKTLCNSRAASLVCGRVKQSLLRRRLGALSGEPRFVSYWAKWLDFQRYLNSLFSFLTKKLFIYLFWFGGRGGGLFLLHWHELRAGKHQTRHVGTSRPPCSATTTADEDTQQTEGRTEVSAGQSQHNQALNCTYVGVFFIALLCFAAAFKSWALRKWINWIVLCFLY